MSVGLLPSTRAGVAADPARALFACDDDHGVFVGCRAGARGEPAVRVRVAALGGAVVTLRPGTTDARTLVDVCLERYHEPARALPTGAVILDLGANIGLTALDLALRHPSARVIAVEMDAGNLEVARANIASVGDRVTLVHAAVWSADGEVEYAPAEEDALSVCTPTAEENASVRRRVRACTVDTLLREVGAERVDYCKMDIEGAEGAVLARAPWLGRVRQIQVEVHPPAATIAGVFDALRGAGLEASVDLRHWSSVVGVRTD